MNLPLTSTTDSAPFDYIDEEGASIIALRRRKRNNIDEVQAKKKLARLISDLTWPMDRPSSSNLYDDISSYQYEVRQVQRQFIIEQPLTRSAQKHRTPYGKIKPFFSCFTSQLFIEALYGRARLVTRDAGERSIVIATISLIFIIGISISLFVVYRACYFEYAQRIYGSASFAGFGNGAESIYGGLRSTLPVCRYDMGRRAEQRFDESLFTTNVEPLGAYRRQY